MKKIIRIFLQIMGILITLILLAWILFAQVAFKFRTPDKDAIMAFRKNQVQLSFHDLEIEGHNIHYAQTGNDTLPTLIFIHGSPGSWDAFEAYLQDEELLKKFRMVSIDRPGFGFSDFGRSENLGTQSNLISPCFRQLANGKPLYLVGHSLGGPLIIKLSADNPGRFSGLVILAGSVDPLLEEKESWRVPLMHFPLEYLAPGAMRPSNKELWWLKKDLVDLKKDFAKIDCPVIIVHGDQDNLVPVANSDYARKMLIHSPSVQLRILPGANHFIPWTRFEEIKEMLLKLTVDR